MGFAVLTARKKERDLKKWKRGREKKETAFTSFPSPLHPLLLAPFFERFFYAPKPHGNARYAGYSVSKALDVAFTFFFYDSSNKNKTKKEILSQKLTGNAIFKLPATGRLCPLLSKLTSAEAAAWRFRQTKALQVHWIGVEIGSNRLCSQK